MLTPDLGAGVVAGGAAGLRFFGFLGVGGCMALGGLKREKGG